MAKCAAHNRADAVKSSLMQPEGDGRKDSGDVKQVEEVYVRNILEN